MKNRFKQQTILARYTRFLGLGLAGAAFCLGLLLPQAAMADPGYQLSVNNGPYSGGNTITVTDGTFGAITNVLVGGVQAAITGSGTTWFTITLPATGLAGAKDIVVQTSDNGAITLTGAYTVNPAGKIGTTVYGPFAWTNLASGMNDSVRALVHDGMNLYAGGNFTTAGGVAANYVAKWDSSSGLWTNLGSGMDGTVRALLHDGTNLYAGGDFTTSGGVTVNRVAKWDSSSGSWTNMGNGMNGNVYALSSDGTNLYAGGAFTPDNEAKVAKWDAASGSWTNLVGSWASGTTAYALAHDGATLFAGGYLTHPSDHPNYATARYAFQWSGAGGPWESIGTWMNSTVSAFTLDGESLYAGGTFTMVGGVAANRVGKWDTALHVWTNLGTGMNGSVNALAHDGANLYAGGAFTTAGDMEANRVGKWNAASSSWTNLASSMNNTVNALAHDGTNLYAGGIFSTAGGVDPNTWRNGGRPLSRRQV